MSTIAEKIGDRLREVRLSLDWTQTKMAVALDIADRTYKFYELGKREIPIHTAVNFCELFSVELKWLILGDGYKNTTDYLEVTYKSIEELLLAIDGIIFANGKPVNGSQFARQAQYLIKQVVDKRSDVKEEAKLLATIIKPGKEE